MYYPCRIKRRAGDDDLINDEVHGMEGRPKRRIPADDDEIDQRTTMPRNGACANTPSKPPRRNTVTNHMNAMRIESMQPRGRIKAEVDCTAVDGPLVPTSVWVLGRQTQQPAKVRA